MNKESNIYTFSFAIIMVLIVGTVLAVTSEVLQPRKKQNQADKKMMNILSAIGVDATRSNAKEKYTEYIYDEIIIDYKGNILKGSAFNVDIVFQYRDKTLMPEDKKYPMFKAKNNNNEYVIIPMVGSGLWGPIWGFISLETDYNTIYGAVFDHEKETPGLGAEINTDFFEEPFKGKKILDNKGQFVSIEVKKGSVEEGHLHQVDGITGGTITSDGVSDMLYNTLDIYNNYFTSLRMDSVVVDSLTQNEL